MAKPKADNRARFLQKFTMAGPNDCWLWTGKTINSGYGYFWVEGTKHMTAHRYAFLQAYGYLPTVVRHSCDVKLCVNPAHLLPGTSKDNSQDMASRHRMGGGNVKLTAAQVEEIRRRFVSGSHGRGGNRRQLALEFGVDSKHIWRIATGRAGDYRITDPKRGVA
ncbi:HNH endonuclease [Streptomyces griseosporeus]|uniref:HNH endonuclease n=1 Tax=Streptomyces griseosporeus TaxID=1910 RepID=UPI003702489F